MTLLHTKFLVHWTGRDFHVPPTDPIDDSIREQYVARLANILPNGLRMQKNGEKSERIYDANGEWIQAGIARTCFTEIKLTMAKRHAQKYGGLGIGVTRDFVVERYGNPVFYVTSGDHSNIIVCARKVMDCLQRTDPQILKEFEVLMAYLKRMGCQNEDDFVYYDELEWRIVHLNRLEAEGRITCENRNEHIYRIRLNREDVRVLVFPDRRTKNIALEDRDIAGFIENAICVTMDDCENF